MDLQTLALSILLSLSSFIGVKSIGLEGADQWNHEGQWNRSNQYPTFMASSITLPELCRHSINSFVEFPPVIQGAQEVWLDGYLITHHGDASFNRADSFYGSPKLRCSEIARGGLLTWRVTSFAEYFARIRYFPRIVPHIPTNNLFAETFHAIGAGSCVLMALFTFIMFINRVSLQLVLSVSFSCLFAALYFAGVVPNEFGLPYDMRFLHKVADTGMWLGSCLLLNAFRSEGLLSANLFRIYIGSLVVGLGLIWMGWTGDIIQLGTTIPFISSMLMLITTLNFVTKYPGFWKVRIRRWQALSLTSFVIACFWEMFFILGIWSPVPVYPFGYMSGILCLAFSVNEQIANTYRERDYLRSHLESEVDRKTKQLRDKTQELEVAMLNLQSTQAELVQSAKLASLGTLAAGIAHEINNSLNYVNGALSPLEKLIMKSEESPSKAKMASLIGVMKEGLNLTIEIIKSLRTYTGLNQAKFNDVQILKVVQSVTTILKNKTRGKIDVIIEIPEDLSVYGSVVGLNQVLMNLISNAIDAMPESGTLTIKAQQKEDSTCLTITDTGSGMSTETQQRMFDPFFTTKEVGKGTGLGLHIVKSEIEKHSGNITVQSELGKGTTFTLTFPASVSTANDSSSDSSSQRGAA